MRVFIVGSTREIPEEQKRKMEDACRRLGGVFARGGHSLILGSDEPDTADTFVVDGADAEPDASPHEIYIYRRRSTYHRPFGDRRFSNVTLHLRDDFREQTAAHAKSIEDADVVLLIGGRQKTLAAGYVAHALDKPYLPILCFGGSAAELWTDFEARYRLCNINDGEFEAVKWKCDPHAVVACCEKLHEAFKRSRSKEIKEGDMTFAATVPEYVDTKSSAQGIRIFISHSSIDRNEASKLVDLLRSALNLCAREIRCSSVDGYRLPAGANVADQLRMEVHADVFIGLLSNQAMKSLWVNFELGARWGSGRPLIPLLTRGTQVSDLKHELGPIAGLNLLSTSQTNHLHQLIAELGKRLSITPEDAHVYKEKIDVISNAE